MAIDYTAEAHDPSEFHIPDSYIKDISIEIDQSFLFSNNPLDDDKTKNSIFIGRRDNIDKFLGFLKSDVKKGAFLVTGYRGMGKTTFVNKVIESYNNSKKRVKFSKKVIPIYLSLAQRDPKEFDILKLITSKVYEAYRKRAIVPNFLRFLSRAEVVIFTILIPVILLIILLAFGNYLKVKEHLELFEMFADSKSFPLNIFSGLMKAGGILILILALCKLLRSLFEKWPNLTIIKNLYERCYSSVSIEKSNLNEITLESLGTKLAGSSSKKSKLYPIAQSKEIEYELSEFFRKTNKIEYIVIFDELDKVDPAISTAYYYDDGTIEKKENEDFYLRELRDRKQAILNIIAGLKNFLTTAHARFIFIAGREMFDASMADIADRQSAISSIFNYVFNIESFLKEKLVDENSRSSLSIIIEEYLNKVLFGAESEGSLQKNFQTYYTTHKNNPTDLNTAYLFLQNFIIYLTYRSNGSPKKLIKVLHEFIKTIPITETRTIKNKGGLRSLKTCKIVKHLNTRNNLLKKDQSSLVLFFNYNNQYKIGFINYLYRPFLVRYGRGFKNYSDNILVATPYLFDHLLKFHPFAFSISNLELIPEVLSTNKTPSLKEHILQIVNYLGNNHLRETEIGLFNYKFYSRTYNEIVFISKTFEEESAAFNFTLDEGYLVKVHVRSKLKELRGTYEKVANDPDQNNQQVFSIAHLNDVLGDLHFFDQEFDDAIVAYADAIKPINNLNVSEMNMRDFVTLIRSKLKLGLTFEKINSYEEALAFYSDASQDAKRFIISRLANGQLLNRDHITASIKHPIDSEKLTSTYHTSALNEILQIINQCFLAKLIIEEKMGMEGVTTQKLALTLGGFMFLAEGISEICGRNNLIISNFYLITGNLLYFKNSNRLFLNIDDKTDETARKISKTNVFREKIPEEVFQQLSDINKYCKNTFDAGEEQQKIRKPLGALCFYIMGVNEILRSRSSNDNSLFTTHPATTNQSNILAEIFKRVRDPEAFGQLYNKNHLRYIATFLSNIGDCLLSMYNSRDDDNHRYNSYTAADLLQNKKVYDSNEFLATNSNFSYYFNVTNKDTTDSITENKLDDIIKGRLKIKDILIWFYLSGQYFLKAGRSVSCSFQYRKILHVLRLVLRDASYPTLFSFSLLKILEKTVVNPVLRIASQNAEHSDRHMIRKYQESLPAGTHRSSILRNISNSPETKEIIYLFSYLRIKLCGINFEGDVRYYEPLFKNLGIATQYSRLFEVDLHAKLSMAIIKCKEQPPLTESSKARYQVSEGEFKNACYDYLFDMASIIKILNVYGTDYLVGYSFQAYTHYRIAEFLNPDRGFSLMQGTINTNKESILAEITTELVALLNRSSYTIRDHIYHYFMAKKFYEKALQLHTAGNEYKKEISNHLYLEDDFNDNAYHFGAALDKYMLVNSVFYERINTCDTILSKANDYHAGTYFNDQ